jgi:hypothetical protein
MSNFGNLENCKVIKKIGLLYFENFEILGFLRYHNAMGDENVRDLFTQTLDGI